MKDLLRLFMPPEWPWWRVIDRLAYVVSLSLFLFLMAVGARTVSGWLLERL